VRRYGGGEGGSRPVTPSRSRRGFEPHVARLAADRRARCPRRSAAGSRWAGPNSPDCLSAGGWGVLALSVLLVGLQLVDQLAQLGDARSERVHFCRPCSSRVLAASFMIFSSLASLPPRTCAASPRAPFSSFSLPPVGDLVLGPSYSSSRSRRAADLVKVKFCCLSAAVNSSSCSLGLLGLERGALWGRRARSLERLLLGDRRYWYSVFFASLSFLRLGAPLSARSVFDLEERLLIVLVLAAGGGLVVDRPERSPRRTRPRGGRKSQLYEICSSIFCGFWAKGESLLIKARLF